MMTKPYQPDARQTAEIIAVGELYRAYDGPRIALDVAREGGGLPELHRRLGHKIRRDDGLRALDTAAGLRIDQRDMSKYSICRAIAAQMRRMSGWRAPMPPANSDSKTDEFARQMTTQDREASGFELELSRDIERASGWAATGFAVPWAALDRRDFNVGTATEAGNLVATEKLLDATPDAARNATVLQRMGALMPGGFRASFQIPIIATDMTNIAYASEVSAATEGQPATAAVTFTPKRITSVLEVSRQAIIQGGAVMDALITRTLMGNAMAAIETAALNGDGTGDNPTGVRSTAGITTVVGGANGAAPAWSHVLDLENGPAVANAPETELAGYIVNAKTRRVLKNTAKASGLAFIWDNTATPLNGYRAGMTNALPSGLVKGTSGAVCSSAVYSSDWSMLMLPVFGTPDVTINPFSKAESGQIRIILNIYMAAGVLRPSAFAKIDDLLTP
jgi:HK97 family phage major capsid protein